MASRRRRPPLRSLNPRGFTLIELLVVLAIMAAVAAALTPMLRIGRAGAELRASSGEMLAAMRSARSNAITHNRTTALVLDPDHNRYSDAGRSHALPRGMTLAWKNLLPVAGGDRVAVYFFPDGSASGGEIDLVSGHVAGAIVVDWFTGLAGAHERAAP
jgi:general secretion pathway protein H